jgi:hypothetical protein
VFISRPFQITDRPWQNADQTKEPTIVKNRLRKNLTRQLCRPSTRPDRVKTRPSKKLTKSSYRPTKTRPVKKPTCKKPTSKKPVKKAYDKGYVANGQTLERSLKK